MLLVKLAALAIAAEITLPFVPVEDDQSGWKCPGGDSWYYMNENGEYVENDWVSDGGNWYYLDRSGRMVEGVKNYRINGVGYDFNSNGVCTNPDAASKKITGWQKMYYSNCQYVYSIQEIVFYNYKFNWYYYGDDGTAVTGWQKIDGKWYCFDDDQSDPWMYYNDDIKYAPYLIEEEVYYFRSNGEMISAGWYNDGKNWRLAKSNGKLYANEWYNENGNWYYFNGLGEMLVDVVNYEINGIDYSFNSKGVCTNPDAATEKHYGWYKKYVYANEYAWYYYDTNGTKVTGWKKISGKWYYLDPVNEGAMVCDTVNMIDDVKYCFDSNGALAEGWYQIHMDRTTYYGDESFDPDIDYFILWYYCIEGVPCTGWKQIGNVWYYFDPDSGIMNSGNILTIDGKSYKFTESGAMCVGWSSYVNKAGTTIWWYSGPDGSLYVNKWLSQGGKWYYFASDAEMVANVEGYKINGVSYDFDENGVCLNP